MPQLFVIVMLPFVIGMLAVAFVVAMSVMEVIPTVGDTTRIRTVPSPPSDIG